MRGLAGKTAIVTGGADGIGRAIVERLCGAGVRVTFSGISDGGVATEEELLANAFSVQFVRGDMAEETFCRELVEAAYEKWGRVNYLVNNAFSFIAKGIDATREEWLRMMNVGPIGYATMAQYAVPKMQIAGGGAIVNISSISARIAQPNRWTYNAAKGAVNQLTRCMAMDLAIDNIRVNTVSPGWIWTREVDNAAGHDRAKWGPAWGKFHMLRRLGEVNECAGPVAFLLSDEASFITATEVMVDGGYHGMGPEGLGEASSFAGSDSRPSSLRGHNNSMKGANFVKMLLMALALLPALLTSVGAAELPSLLATDGLGVNIHFTDSSRNLNMIQASGCKFVRMDLRWDQVERVKGTYNFSAFDKLVNACAARGIRVLSILDYGNSLYGEDPTSATWLDGFTNFAAAAADRYKNKGLIYEIYNEPNHPKFWPGGDGATATEYMALANQAIPAMRIADPNSTISAPSLSSINLTFLKTCFQHGLLDLVDAVGVHAYRSTAPETVVGNYAGLRTLMQTFGKTVPILTTEWGYSTGSEGAIFNPVTAQRQGDYLARTFLVNLSQGIRLSIWYDWKDDGPDPDEYEKNFGTVTFGLEPKPAYNELQLLTTSLAGTTFSTQLSDGNSADWLLVFKTADGHETLAAWTTGNAHSASVSGWGTVALSSTPLYMSKVPEPSTLVLSAVGLLGLWAYSLRRKNRIR